MLSITHYIMGRMWRRQNRAWMARESSDHKSQITGCALDTSHKSMGQNRAWMARETSDHKSRETLDQCKLLVCVEYTVHTMHIRMRWHVYQMHLESIHFRRWF